MSKVTITASGNYRFPNVAGVTESLVAGIQFEFSCRGFVDVEVSQGPAADDNAGRYERALRAIQRCTLLGANFGDYVQAVCDDVLEGGEAECWNCGTVVHEGPCVGEAEGEGEGS